MPGGGKPRHDGSGVPFTADLELRPDGDVGHGGPVDSMVVLATDS